MPVVGFTINSIEAKREKEFPNTQISINSSPLIFGIREVDVQAFDKKILALDFEFMTTYEPNAASIKVAGELLYVANDNKKILDAWDRNKTIPNEDSVEILNFMFRRCILKVLNLSDDLQLPPPVSFPFVTKAKPEEEPKAQKRAKTEPEEDEKEKELKEKIKKLTSK